MKSTFIKYLVLCIVLMILTEITKYALNFDKLFYNSLSEKLTTSQINDFFDFQEKWNWLGYVFTPIYVLVKTSLVASCVYIGIFFFVKKEISLNSIWEIVLKAEFIFLLVPIFKIVWFYFFQTKYELEDFQFFHPLSALNIIGYKGLESWFIYPFQTLNLFELAYIIYLANQVGKITGANTDFGLKIIAYTYVPTLILWVAVFMFFTLNNS